MEKVGDNTNTTTHVLFNKHIYFWSLDTGLHVLKNVLFSSCPLYLCIHFPKNVDFENRIAIALQNRIAIAKKIASQNLRNITKNRISKFCDVMLLEALALIGS